uniref:Uncharacterized protein n=1 Tax=Ditylenchus dipsaci TaxID=166011 RepID=A0A915DQC4_9BILA
MALRQKRHKKQMEAAQNITPKSDSLMSSSQFGSDVCRTVHSLEQKQLLPSGQEFAGDCVYFNASNSNGWYFTLGLAHRPNDIINLFFIVKVPGLGTFINSELPYCSNVPSQPSTTHYQTKSGFSAHCVEPMKEWRIQFTGHLIRQDQCPEPKINIIGKDQVDLNVSQVEASFNLVWKTLEPWSRAMFKKLKESHQSHYEQFGFMTGEFKLREEGKEAFESGQIEMVSMRDHTITRFRRWNQLRRYIMMIYHLEDGTCIHTSLISMPEVVFSHLQFGYVITPEKHKLAADSINLHLVDIGEDKHFPTQFFYSFR